MCLHANNGPMDPYLLTSLVSKLLALTVAAAAAAAAEAGALQLPSAGNHKHCGRLGRSAFMCAVEAACGSQTGRRQSLPAVRHHRSV